MPWPTADQPLGWLILFGAGFLASGVNSVAGGGSLISFPALMALGIPPLPANATNSVALWPGSFAGAMALREHLKDARQRFRLLLPPTLVGSVLGAWLLVVTDPRAFDLLVPWLILVATVLLALQPRVQDWTSRQHKSQAWLAVAAQFGVGVYGGYFGAGMGIMMLAVISLCMQGTIHEMNAVKNWLGLAINFAASLVLVSRGLVMLEPGLALMAGALVGGYASARWSVRVKSQSLRWAIVVYGFIMASWFLWRALA